MSGALRAGYKQTEVGVIPADWQVRTIESMLTEISMGPFGSDIKVSNFVPKGVPVLSGVNVRTERLNDSFSNFVTPAKAKTLKKAVASRGDIVVTHRGTLGQISFIPPDSEFPCYVISQSQFRARFKADVVLPYWVTLYFLSPNGSAKLLEGKGHTGVPALAQATTKFRQLNLPLPPLPEQRAIATALSDVDALLAKLDALVAKKRDLKVAAMQQLLTGQTRLPGFTSVVGYKQTEFGLIPLDWAVKSLNQISPKQSVGLVINPSTYFDEAGTVPMLVGSNIKENSIQWEDAKRITESSNNLISASRLAAGDLVTVRVGDPGVTAVVPPELDGCNCASVMIVRKNDSFNSHWLCSAMNSSAGRKQVSNVQYGTAQKQFNISDAVNFAYRVPPREEQTAIATVLFDMEAELTALEVRRDKTRALKKAIMQELLTGRIRLV